MQTDKLNDIEELLYYRNYYKSHKAWTVIAGVLSFLLGLAAANTYHRYFGHQNKIRIIPALVKA